MGVRYWGIFIIVFFTSLSLLAQEDEPGKYDFLLAGTLLREGDAEIKLFNALYHQNQYDGFEELNSQSSYFSSFLQVSIGIYPNLNVGFDLIYKSNILNAPFADSPFNPLLFNRKLLRSDSLFNKTSDYLPFTNDHGLTHVGQRIRFIPFKTIPLLSFQQSFYAPIERKIDGNWTSFSQIFFDYLINSKSNVFIELSLWYDFFPRPRALPFFKIFYNFFPNEHWTFYATTTIPYEYGGGIKYRPIPNLEFELLYTKYLPIERFFSGVLPQTFNLGIRHRIIH